MPVDLPAVKLPTLGRLEFCQEFAYRHRPGEHTCLIGPTGRGKSVLTGQVVPLLVRHATAAILAPKGRDPAFSSLGDATRSWPPKMPWTESLATFLGARGDHREDRPRVWRVEVPIRSSDDFVNLQAVYARVLGSALSRREGQRDGLVLVLDDSRFLSDQLRLSKLIVALMMIGRSKNVSVFNNFQAPRWVPRETIDQASYHLIWRNRDKDVGKRLAEISGDLDPKMIEAAIASLDYHACLWVDGRRDELFLVLPR